MLRNRTNQYCRAFGLGLRGTPAHWLMYDKMMHDRFCAASSFLVLGQNTVVQRQQHQQCIGRPYAWLAFMLANAKHVSGLHTIYKTIIGGVEC